ncbi:hypothetical protein H4N55_12890 [Aeromonas veronii]|uniref:hypothetical protein n=1 Tax=Aeromonas TaxID=642 RepID=UPI00188A9F01|nr:hypothetical protein [Aeromonas veronii]MBF3237493.1 hypothetical protein [Aeromonas veronii]
MSVLNCYQTYPDNYVRFNWGGKSIEGEFYEYNSVGNELGSRAGYIRPFDKILRQSLIDNIQAAQNLDLQDFLYKDELITCDAFVTHPSIRRPYQYIINEFEFITEDELVTNKDVISSCRADLLSRQYRYGKNQKESDELLNNILTEYRICVTPNDRPLRYERTNVRKNLHRISVVLNWLFTICVIFATLFAILK